MKTMRLVTTLFLALGLMFISCDKEGAVGPIGPAGPQGVAGEQGPQGVEGNANVQTYTFDTATEGGFEYIQLSFEELTQDVLDNDVVLTYIQRTTFGDTSYFTIPGISIDEIFEVELRLGEMNIYAYTLATGDLYEITVGEIPLIKTVIIKSASTTAAKTAAKDVLLELKKNGVDINDYNQVADYYGLE